jgi:hypothetical protein
MPLSSGCRGFCIGECIHQGMKNPIKKTFQRQRISPKSARSYDLLFSVCKVLKVMVGAEGFEPPTLCSQSRCATRLRYAPTCFSDCIVN